MNLTITPSMNTKRHPSFGGVSIMQMRPVDSWLISIERTLPNMVEVDGFNPFLSQHAQGVVDKVRDLGQDVLKPRFYGDLKQRLLLILQEISEKRPAFSKEYLQEIKKMIEEPTHEFRITEFGLQFGDLSG